LNSFNQNEIEDYLILIHSKNKIDDSYKKLYKDFYALNAARLSETFYKKYFDILKYEKIEDRKIEDVYEIEIIFQMLNVIKMVIKKYIFHFLQNYCTQ
jgi:hypothetical protein